MTTRVFHILLAFLVFVSSSGLVLSQHFCGGELKSTALFAEAPSCHQQKELKSCPMHGNHDPDQDDKGCCDTQTKLLKVEDAQTQASMASYTIDLPFLIAYAPANSFSLSDGPEEGPHPYLTYKPPVLVCDAPVVLQTFRC